VKRLDRRRTGLLGAAAALFMLSCQAQVGDKVRLPSFSIDRTEVTIGQFERYVRATGTVTRAEKRAVGLNTVQVGSVEPGGPGASPMVCKPMPTCLPCTWTLPRRKLIGRWAAGRLPTGAEWQQAGFTESRDVPPAPWVKGRTYPWTTGDNAQGANTSEPDPWPRAAPAGATRQGVNGLYDMGANVWEWTTDVPGDDRRNERRTVGGSWWYGPFNMRPMCRPSSLPTFMRCTSVFVASTTTMRLRIWAPAPRGKSHDAGVA